KCAKPLVYLVSVRVFLRGDRKMRAFARRKPVGRAQRADNTRSFIGMLTRADHHRGIAALAISRAHRSARTSFRLEWLAAQSGNFTADLIGGKRRLRRLQNL